MIKELLQNKNALERAEIKARELSRVPKIKSFKVGDLAVEILKSEANGRDLVLELKVMRGKKEVPVDNPFIFRNPPIMVPDGTYREEVEDGETVRKANFKEDAQAAIKSIIADTLRIVIK